MPNLQKAKLGDAGFIGVDTRTNPANLGDGYLQEGMNIRIEETELSTRKGIKSLFGLAEYGDLGGPILKTSTYIDQIGQEYVVLLFEEGIRIFNITTKELSEMKLFETRVIGGTTYVRSADENSEIVQAVSNLYITRGPTVKWHENATVSSGASPHTTITVTTVDAHGMSVGDEFAIESEHAPQSGTFFVETVVNANSFTYILPVGHNGSGTATVAVGKPVLCWKGGSVILPVRQEVLDGNTADFPMCSLIMYHRNRIYCKVERDEIAVSDYLLDDEGEWVFNRTIQQFQINQGDGQEITGFFPWTEDKVLIFKDRSIYQAKFADSTDSPAILLADSYVQTLSSELGVVSSTAIANIGTKVFFVSKKGVYAIEPQLDIRLLANTIPLSRPVQKYFDRININRLKNVVAKVFNGRLFIALSMNAEDGTEANYNSTVMVYNVLNQAWESVDTYPEGFDVNNMHVLSWNNKYELILSDFDGTIFVAEQNEYDEYGELNDLGIRLIINAPPAGTNLDFNNYTPNGNAILSFEFPKTDELYVTNPIKTKIVTRNYIFGTLEDKRYSAVKISASTDKYCSMQIDAIMTNEDSVKVCDLTGYSNGEDFIEKSPIGKVASEGAIRLTTQNGRVNVHSVAVEATTYGSNLRNRK